MIYNVIFNVNEEELLNLAEDQGQTKLTPKELFAVALVSLDRCGINATEITEIK